MHFCVPWAQVKLVSHQNIAMDEYGFKTEDVASFQVMGSRGRPYQFSLDGFNKEGAMIFVNSVRAWLPMRLVLTLVASLSCLAGAVCAMGVMP